jgi:uncharacterized damage-inducible protein DinB
MLLKLLVSLQLCSLISQEKAMPEQSKTIQQEIQMDSTAQEQDDLPKLMRRYAAYNLWANQQMAKWLDGATEEAFNREIESSFKSLKTTVSHIWNAEYLWLQIMKGEEVAKSPAKDFEGNKDQFLKAWLLESEKFSEYLNGMTSKQFQDHRPSSSGKGAMRMVDMIQHCLNHSTYHRGQLITMGRQAGLADPPRTDFIYYVGLPPETK